MKQRGFTIIELIVAIVFLLVIGSIFLMQKNDLEARNRDSGSKVAINTIYYNLEEVFYPTNGYYPQQLQASQLKGLDPAVLKDANGKVIGDKDSKYRYEGLNCSDSKCKGYSLRATLEREDDFVKNNRNH